MSARRKNLVSEVTIEKSIIQILRWRGAFCFKVANGGSWDPANKVFRFNHAVRLRGVPDILGLYKTLPIAVEVKSAKGKLSEHQEKFLADWRAAGGFSAIVRSIDDVLAFLAELDSIAKSQEKEKIKECAR